MEQNSTTNAADGTALFAGDAWFDPIKGSPHRLLNSARQGSMHEGIAFRADFERGFCNGNRQI